MEDKQNIKMKKKYKILEYERDFYRINPQSITEPLPLYFISYYLLYYCQPIDRAG